MSKLEIIDELLDAQNYALSEWDQKQFAIWSRKVGYALKSTGLVEDYEIWSAASSDSNYTYSDQDVELDPTYVAHVKSMIGILKGVKERIKLTEPLEPLLPIEYADNSKVYVKKLLSQINGCYESGYMDASAVLMRRLVEILIIDCFNNYGLRSKIEKPDGNYFGLDGLINAFLREKSWHISRSLKRYLPKLKVLKEIGDQAAHGINITPKGKITRLKDAVINTYQGLLDLAYS